MESIRIQGLRSLEDTGNIRLAPLTVLLGENSAGKSTFLRTFPLLKQSMASNTRGAILWYGSFVDFGDFEQALSRFSTDGVMGFSFGINLLRRYGLSAQQDYVAGNIPQHYQSDYKLNFKLKKDNKNNGQVFKFSVDFKGIFLEVTLNQTKGKIDSLFVNGLDLTRYFEGVRFNRFSNNKLVPIFVFENDFEKFTRNIRFANVFINEVILNKLEVILQPFTRKGTKISEIVEKVIRADCSTLGKFFEELKSSSATKTWKIKIDSIKDDEKLLEEIRCLVFLFNFPSLLYVFSEYLDSYTREISYIAPMRATAERYYRAQNLNVEQVDHQGNNLPMFVENLSEIEKKDFKGWMERNFGFYLDAISSTGHLSLFIHYSGSDKDYNVTDMGFGFSQLLPIITQLWFSTTQTGGLSRHYSTFVREKILVIEQPELHLHPRMQAMLMDVFAKTIRIAEKEKFKIKIIIETHSETFINYIGRCILKGEISKDDTSIVIFNKDSPSSPTKVSVSQYDDDGCLKNWPWGFFDTE